MSNSTFWFTTPSPGVITLSLAEKLSLQIITPLQKIITYRKMRVPFYHQNFRKKVITPGEGVVNHQVESDISGLGVAPLQRPFGSSDTNQARVRTSSVSDKSELPRVVADSRFSTDRVYLRDFTMQVQPQVTVLLDVPTHLESPAYHRRRTSLQSHLPGKDIQDSRNVLTF